MNDQQELNDLSDLYKKIQQANIIFGTHYHGTEIQKALDDIEDKIRKRYGELNPKEDKTITIKEVISE